MEENIWNEKRIGKYQEKVMEIEKQLRKEIRKYRKARIYGLQQIGGDEIDENRGYTA